MEYSFGIIPLLRQAHHDWKTLLIKHRKGHWGFPKGHPDAHESQEQTAQRELEEETGLRVKHILFAKPLRERYQFQHQGKFVQKEVVYYIAEVAGQVSLQTEEISDFRWVTFDEGLALMTFKEGKNLIQQTKLLLDTVEGAVE